MHDDVNFESRLMAFARDADDPDMAAHIAGCQACQEDLETVRHLARYQAATGPAGFLAPPDPVDEALLSLFATVRPDLVPASSPSPISRVADRLRVITAELFSDSGASPQLAGLRSDGPQKTRHLAFMSQVADLDLEITEAEPAWSVAGQVGMDQVPSDLSIRFVPAHLDPATAGPPEIISAPVSDAGYFSVSLSAGEWSAAINVDDATVVFPGVRL